MKTLINLIFIILSFISVLYTSHIFNTSQYNELLSQANKCIKIASENDELIEVARKIYAPSTTSGISIVKNNNLIENEDYRTISSPDTMHIMVPINFNRDVIGFGLKKKEQNWYDLNTLFSHSSRYSTLILMILYALVSSLHSYYSRRKFNQIIASHALNVENIVHERDAVIIESKKKSEFISKFSHELRTPLSAIIGFSKIIREDEKNSDTSRDYASDINDAGNYLLSFINDILDYSKAEAGKLTIDFEKVDLVESLNRSIKIIKSCAGGRKIKLITKCDVESVIINANCLRMQQTIINILSNAIKFTDVEGTVLSKIIVKDDYVTLSISDNGSGINRTDIYVVMSEYGQSRDTQNQGTGLGLPLSKKMTELMHGKFSIKSEKLIGTVVEISFPIVK